MRFSYSPLNPIVISLAVWLAAWTLQPMLVDDSYMGWVGIIVAASAVAGALGALVRAPRILTISLQLVVMLALLAWRGLSQAAILTGTAELGPVESIAVLVQAGSRTVREGAVPLPSETGLLWLIACVIALVTLAVELLVDGLEQPAWSMAPLAVLYGIGALALPREMSWQHFLLVAVGYVAILLVATGFGSGRRAGSPAQVGSFQGSRLAVGAAVAALAAALALFITPTVPLAQKQPWLEAGSDAPIQLSDPTIALNENLNRPEETDVLFYRTSDGEPTYLRTVALTRLTTSGAQLVPMQLETGGLEDAYDGPGEPVEVDVEMVFGSEYLPVPFAVDSFAADGRWAFDPITLAVVATGSDRQNQTSALRYNARATAPDPTREELEVAMAGADPDGEESARIPEGLSAEVTALTNQVTELATTDGAKAMAIQSYLRSEPFQYSLEAPQSTGLDTISAFLLQTRAGYCIHFASAMVTMARIEGIPARMAVGFTPGEPSEDGFRVTTHNMHTWPELYFEGLGWVPFEPTKSIASPPEYTDPDVGPTPAPSESPTSSPSASPSPTTQPSPSPSPTTPPDPDGESDAGSLVGWLILFGALLLAALPLLVRTGQRLWRLRPGQDPQATAAAAWNEVRSTFIDLRLDWNSHTPTLAARAMAGELAPSSASLLSEIALTVERASFARGGADVSGLAEQVATLRRDLLRTQSGNRQVQALFLPASLLLDLPRWRPNS